MLIGGPSFLPSYDGQRGIQRKNQNLDRHFTLFAPAPYPTEVGSESARGGRTKTERLFIPGPEGKLEALLEFEPRARPRAVAIVCHPHPLYGGTMHNQVVHRAAKAALQADLPVLRFNFRGVGKSAGEFAHGVGEREDVHAALDLLATRFPEVPVCMIGFSFGAVVALAVGAADPRVRALAGLGVPAASADLGFLRGVTKPKLIVQGTEDIFGTHEQIEALFASLAEPKRLHWVEGADHFFTGKLNVVQSAIRGFLQEVAAPPRVE